MTLPRTTSILLLAFALAACSQAKAPADNPAPKPLLAAAPTPVQATARLGECRTQLEAALKQGTVTNASFDNGRPILWVGAPWKTATTETRVALSRQAACFFLSGDESKTIRFSVYDNDSDREVAVWNHDALVEL